MIKNKAQPLQKLRLHPKQTQQRKTSWSDKLPSPSRPLLRATNNSRELSAHSPPTVVAKEVAEVVAVEVMANVVETVNVVATARAAEVMVKTEVVIVPVERVVDADAVKGVVVVDVAEIDPGLPSLKVTQVQLLNAPNVEAKEKDSKASPVKMLTPWIVRTVLDVDIVVTVKVELLARAPGVMKRNLSLKVKPQLLRQPNQKPSKKNANQESPVRDERDPRDQLKKKRNPNPLLKKKK